MPLTPDQLEHWPSFLDDPHEQPGQTTGQTITGRSSLKYWCWLEGLGIPSAEDSREYMGRGDLPIETPAGDA
jgi:hypothetical protein